MSKIECFKEVLIFKFNKKRNNYTKLIKKILFVYLSIGYLKIERSVYRKYVINFTITM